MGIRVLRNEKDEWKIGPEVEKVINKYTKEMWGTKDKLIEEIAVPEDWKQKAEREKEIDQILNAELGIGEMDRAIKKLKRKKTPGEDLVAKEIFMAMSREEREKVLKMLEICRMKSEFPKGWKETELRWIYKKADPTRIKNYRPIALTDTLYKIYTRIMTERLERAVEKFGLITEVQQGFRSDRSCLAAVMTMSIIMARRLEKTKEKPFYVAYIDISKAFDTVSHEQLWKILEKTGIKGTWLDNLKELYKNNFLRSFTPEGKTSKIRMERGIRQGCPLSPLLFALYVNPIAMAMEKINKKKDKEPAMLMYADDMVVWGDTEEEIKEKLETAMTTMQSLGLQMSTEKTELQHNKWTIPSKEGGALRLEVNGKETEIEYQPVNKPIRYLGIWSTATMETERGLELLKDKMEERLNRVKGTKSNPCTKVNLIKSRIISTWNYTTAIQDIERTEIKKWEEAFYEAIAVGEFHRVRKQMVYESRQKAGFGMTKLSEEYDINRLRTISQIMEAGERIKGRGQTPWAQKLLLEELSKSQPGRKPCLRVIEEMQGLLKNLDLTMEKTEEKYKRWSEQDQIQTIQEEKEHRNSPICNITREIGGIKLPAHLIDYYEMHKEELEPGQEGWEKALEKQREKQNQVEVMKEKGQIVEASTGIRLKPSTIRNLERLTGTKVAEWGVSIENRSTENLLNNNMILEKQQNRNQIILINRTNPMSLRQTMKMKGVKEEETEIIVREALNQGAMVLILEKGNTKRRTDYMIYEKAKLSNLVGLENPYSQRKRARFPEDTEELQVAIMSTTKTTLHERVIAEITRTSDREINNMYTPTVEEDEQNTEWTCPLCKKKGEKINEFGICREKNCMGIRTQRSFRNRTEVGIRKAETVLLGKQHTLKEGCKTRTFWSDGSGRRAMKTKVQTTGWGLVECKQHLTKEGFIEISKEKEWKGRS